METEVKVDMTLVPEDIKGDIFKEAQWKENEKNRLTAEVLAKKEPVASVEPTEPTEPVEPENKEVKTELDLSEFTEFEIKTKDEIKERLKEHGLTKKEITELKQQLESKNNEYQQFIEKTKANPFTDPDLYRLNHIKREKPDEYNFYKKVVMGGADGIELLKAQFLKDNPDEKPETIELYLKNKYGFDKQYDPDDPEEMKTKQLNEFAFRQDVKKIKDSVLKTFNEITVPEPTIKDEKEIEKEKQEVATKLAEQRTTARKAWTPLAEKIVKALDKMPILVTGEGDEKVKEFMDYIIPEESKKEFLPLLVDFLTDKPLTEQSISEAQAHVRLVYLINHLPEINVAYGDKVRAMNDEEWQKIRVNPSALQSKSNKDKGKDQSDDAKKKEAQKQIFEKLGGNKQNY